MTLTPDEVAAVAGKLTRGEARAIQAADERGRLPRDYPGGKSTGRARITLPTLRNLEAAALITFHPPMLTPLGLAVRDYLPGEQP